MSEKTKPATVSRLLVLLSGAMLVVLYFFPMWKIELTAPQYPEGLELKIWVNDIGGDVEVINGLNHYIGMQTLHAEAFIEFTVLPWIIAFLIAFALVSFMMNSRKWVYINFFVFTTVAVISMADFYRWEYNYGHDLDPTAPIKIPGSSYQPPFIGYKKLLNFGAYSIPDTGGWFFVGSGVALALAAFAERRRSKKDKKMKSHITKAEAAAVFSLALLLASCSTEPKAIEAGKDQCVQCKMSITDTRFAVQLVTGKGKVYFFDDMVCLLDFIRYGEVKKEDIAQIYCADYASPANWIKAEEGVYLSGENLRSPMGGNMVAFSSDSARAAVMKELSGYPIDWPDIYH